MRKTGLLSFALMVGVIAATLSSRLARAEPVDDSSQARPTTGTSPVGLDACALLTPQEAAAALGGAVKQPKPTRTIESTLGPGIPTVVSGCTYDTGTKEITLGVRHTTDASVGRLRQMMQIVCDGKQPVSGVGDVACWYSAAHDELHTLKGATFLSVELKRSGDAAVAITGVAKKALARVP